MTQRISSLRDTIQQYQTELEEANKIQLILQSTLESPIFKIVLPLLGLDVLANLVTEYLTIQWCLAHQLYYPRQMSMCLKCERASIINYDKLIYTFAKHPQTKKQKTFDNRKMVNLQDEDEDFRQHFLQVKKTTLDDICLIDGRKKRTRNTEKMHCILVGGCSQRFFELSSEYDPRRYGRVPFPPRLKIEKK